MSFDTLRLGQRDVHGPCSSPSLFMVGSDGQDLNYVCALRMGT